MRRLQGRTWGKLALGVLVIGGTIATLWAVFGAIFPTTFEPEQPAKPRALHGSRGVVLVRFPRHGVERATIACDGRRHRATGFWSANPAEACDALGSTRAALLSGRGCAELAPGRLHLHASGHFGAVRFDHRSQKGGCPDPDAWLHVDALIDPLVSPERKLAGAPPEDNG